jgi:hypothetical protein
MMMMMMMVISRLHTQHHQISFFRILSLKTANLRHLLIANTLSSFLTLPPKTAAATKATTKRGFCFQHAKCLINR